MDQHYHVMSISANGNVEDMKAGYISLVKYSATYFSVNQMAPLTLWKNIFKISKDVGKHLWKKTLLRIEIALCALQSNAALEIFFSQLKYVKNNLLTRL